MSAPRRGNFACAVARRVDQCRSSELLSPWLQRAADARDLILLQAVLCMAAAFAVHLLTPHVLATALFVLSALLASLVLVAAKLQPEATPRRAARTHVHARLTELHSSSHAHQTLDKAHWARLTSHMSHELRTPLNAVLGFSEMMSNEVFGPLGSSCYTSYAKDIHASGRVLLKSAEDALAITALLTAPSDSGVRTVNLEGAMVEAENFVRPDLSARLQQLDVNGQWHCDVVGECQTIRQILLNVLSHASAASAEGAQLSACATECNGRVLVSLTSSDVRGEAADGFALMLARTLCDLCGAELSVGAGHTPGSVRWSVELQAATQRDFFS